MGSRTAKLSEMNRPAMELDARTNLALRKPATQSSLGGWAMADSPEVAAGFANNGSTRSGVCHTAREKGPWWQVDLEEPRLVEAIRLHARPSRLDRLIKVRVAGSMDGRSWNTMLRKRPDEAGNKHITLNFGAGYAARHVRVVLDTTDYLDFCECEVFGVALPEGFGARDVVTTPGGTSVIQLGGFDVFARADRYGDLMIDALRKGRYEAHERRLARDLLNYGDRVLEVGTAIGVVTMTAASIVGAENIMTFDANPQIVSDAQENFALNDLAGIASHVGVLANRGSEILARQTVPFGIARQFWASRLFANGNEPDIVDMVEVKTVCLEGKIAEHRATALICDIEGGETELLTGADLTGIRTIIMETHTRRAGVELTNAMMRKLIGQDGFNLDLGRSGAHVVGLQR